MNSVFRTPAQQARYEAYQAAGNLDKGCVLCEQKALKAFEHWRVIENIFPYDKIAKLHYMIVPKRHVAEQELFEDETKELREIKEAYVHQDYDFIIEATRKIKTVPGHFHLHLIVAKD